jgi:hypothetical protein
MKTLIHLAALTVAVSFADIGHCSTFTTSLYGEKVTTEMELVTLDGATYFETKADGVYMGSTHDMVSLLSPDLLKDAQQAEAADTNGIAATIEGHAISGFKAIAGKDGMHIHVDLQAGGMNFGKGIRYDILQLHRVLLFKEGEVKLPRLEGDKEVGLDIYVCAKGAKIGPAKAAGKLYITGITHKYVAKDESEKK